MMITGSAAAAAAGSAAPLGAAHEHGRGPHAGRAGAPVGLAAVVGLVVVIAPAALASPERQALRLACCSVRDALDAAVIPSGLVIWTDRLKRKQGATRAQQLACFITRPGCGPPVSITIRAEPSARVPVDQL